MPEQCGQPGPEPDEVGLAELRELLHQADLAGQQPGDEAQPTSDEDRAAQLARSIAIVNKAAEVLPDPYPQLSRARSAAAHISASGNTRTGDTLAQALGAFGPRLVAARVSEGYVYDPRKPYGWLNGPEAAQPAEPVQGFWSRLGSNALNLVRRKR